MGWHLHQSGATMQPWTGPNLLDRAYPNVSGLAPEVREDAGQ
jgi:hypothetical protein